MWHCQLDGHHRHPPSSARRGWLLGARALGPRPPVKMTAVPPSPRWRSCPASMLLDRLSAIEGWRLTRSGLLMHFLLLCRRSSVDLLRAAPRPLMRCADLGDLAQNRPWTLERALVFAECGHLEQPRGAGADRLDSFMPAFGAYLSFAQPRLVHGTVGTGSVCESIMGGLVLAFV